MSNKSDFEIIDAVLNGNVQAYTILINRYKNMVFTLSYRLLNDNQFAEELAQDVFVKAYQNLAQFKKESKFSSWLYTITYRTGLNIIKKNKSNKYTENLDHLFEVVEDNTPDSLQIMTAQEKSLDLQQSLKLLDPEDQYLIQLYYYEELSLKEIMEIVDISETNLKSRLFRSRKKLYSLLKHKM